MSNVEKYLESLRELPTNEKYFTEAYLILDSEIRRLEAVVAMMKNKDRIPDSDEFQSETLQSVTQNISLLRDFLKEAGEE